MARKYPSLFAAAKAVCDHRNTPDLQRKIDLLQGAVFRVSRSMADRATKAKSGRKPVDAMPILKLLKRGKSAKEIAAEVGVSERTVYNVKRAAGL